MIEIVKKPYVADCGVKNCKICQVVNAIKSKQHEEENKK